MNLSWRRETFTISTDPGRLELVRIHEFLANSYWAQNIPIEIVKKSLSHSLCFGLYADRQIGLARVVSDYSTFAYIGDVYVENEFQGQGLGKWLMKCVMSHPELQGLRRYCLGTRDAHGLYRQFGFEVIQKPENWMEIRVHDIYKKL